MDVIQIEMIHKRQNENIVVFLAHGDLYFLMLYCTRCSVCRRTIRWCRSCDRNIPTPRVRLNLRRYYIYIILCAVSVYTLLHLLLLLLLRKVPVAHWVPSFQPTLCASALRRKPFPVPARARTFWVYLEYFNRRPGVSPSPPPHRGRCPRTYGFAWLRSKILSFHITHCDGYHTKAIKGSDNGSQMGPNSNCVCVFTFRPNSPRRLLRQLSE